MFITTRFVRAAPTTLQPSPKILAVAARSTLASPATTASECKLTLHSRALDRQLRKQELFVEFVLGLMGRILSTTAVRRCQWRVAPIKNAPLAQPYPCRAGASSASTTPSLGARLWCSSSMVATIARDRRRCLLQFQENFATQVSTGNANYGESW